MTRLVPLSEFLDSTHLPAEIVQLWEGSFHFLQIGVNFRLEHQCERRAEEPQMSKSENAKSYTERAASEPTELHKNFAAWIEEQTGYAPDLKTVQIVCAMRMDFQRSEENQQDLKARKQAAAKKKADEAKARKAKLEAQLAKIQADLAKETAAEQPAEKPAPAAKKTAPSKTAAATTTPRRTATAKVAEAPAPKRAPRVRRTAAKTA